MDLDMLLQSREHPDSFAETLTASDVEALAPLLAEQNDDLRYCAFLALQARSRISSGVYPYWERFAAMLEEPNSYRRNVALRLLAENVRWDREKKFSALFSQWMAHCQDEKFVTCRQALQSIPIWAPHAPELAEETAKQLMEINLSAFRDSQQKLILTDILEALSALRPYFSSPETEEYFAAALERGLLDKKTRKRFSS